MKGGTLSETSSLTSTKDVNRCQKFDGLHSCGLLSREHLHPLGIDIDDIKEVFGDLGIIRMYAFPWCSSPEPWMKRCSSRLVANSFTR